MKELAPICLFTYNRFDETKQTVEALQKNFLAKESDLIIFSDGAKNDKVLEKILKIRKYLKTIDGFKSVKIYESPTNQGLATSIINGVSQVIKKYKKVVVLEDDLITSPNFLNFINQALSFYKEKKDVFSISGYTMDLRSLNNYEKDYYLGLRASSWGWGIWIDRWGNVDWSVEDYDNFKWNLMSQYRFMKGGSDLPHMLRKQMNKKIDSWAIRWCYYQFKNNLLTVFASKSKIVSIGFGPEATHTKKTDRFETKLDDGSKRIFEFDEELIRNKKLEKEFRNKFSMLNRLKNKLL
ncbi:MAG: glycosyltransferase [Flavobacteriaceae bacterium]|nr:glycosyltransferase [Flavobacteriaceae bacterium]